MQQKLRELRVDYDVSAQLVQISLLKLKFLAIKAGFCADQPRGDDGKWCGGSGKLVVTRRVKTGNRRIDSTTDIIIDVLDEVVSTFDPGSGPTYGVQIHAGAAAILRSLDLPGIGTHGIEQSFSLGDTVRYGLNGSIRTDIVMRDGRTADAPILAVWDIKTGEARLSPKRAAEIRRNLGIGDEIPVIELHIKRGVSVKSYICRY